MSFKPLMIGSMNAKAFLELGIGVLRDGGSAIDAVEATVRGVEDNPSDTSVGYGGIPNLLGEVELDASMMDGRTLRTGAVAGIKHFKNPISIARKVMETTPHALMIGEGAERFADASGFTRTELLTDYTRELYRAFATNSIEKLDSRFDRHKASLLTDIKNYGYSEWYKRLSEEHHGTVNVMAMDSRRDICTGVSTSGLALKMPGRVGDSPIIGAGNYADNRYGGAACTGRGELTIRLLSSRMIVSYMQSKFSVQEACMQAMRDVNGLRETGGINCIAMDCHGNTFSASNRRLATYSYMNVDQDTAEERTGALV